MFNVNFFPISKENGSDTTIAFPLDAESVNGFDDETYKDASEAYNKSSVCKLMTSIIDKINKITEIESEDEDEKTEDKIIDAFYNLFSYIVHETRKEYPEFYSSILFSVSAMATGFNEQQRVDFAKTIYSIHEKLNKKDFEELAEAAGGVSEEETQSVPVDDDITEEEVVE